MLEFFKQKKKVITIVFAIILLGGYYIYNINNDYTIEEGEEILVSENDTTESKEKTEDEEMIAIHITGSVNTPGVVRVKEGSRIEDVIEAAGGLTEDADITNVNLAYMVNDGIKIRIPSINDDFDDEDDYILEDNGSGVVISDDSSSSSSSKVNINTATQTELETLSGIGPSLATKIIEYRESNGKFTSIEDIKNVSGIGDSKCERIKDYIEV